MYKHWECALHGESSVSAQRDHNIDNTDALVDTTATGRTGELSLTLHIHPFFEIYDGRDVSCVLLYVVVNGALYPVLISNPCILSYLSIYCRLCMSHRSHVSAYVVLVVSVNGPIYSAMNVLHCE